MTAKIIEMPSAESGALIPAQRHALILEYVRRAGAVSIQQIVAHLRSSQSTVRRDLQELTELGYLERTRGGATLRERPRTMFESSREIAAHISHPAKSAIGNHAAAMIGDDQSVIFDSSSTVMAAARKAVSRGIRFTAVTNDLGIAHEMADNPRISVIVAGGTLRPGSLTLTGEPGIDFLKKLSVDIAFIGMHAMSGLRASETSLEVAAIKRAFIAAARHAVLLVDSTKFGANAFCDVGDLSQFHEVVTDANLPVEIRRQIEERGIDVTCVPVGE